MVKKLKIPSNNVMITGNHIYKGYYAEYRSRLRQGEFLVVHLGSNGHEAIIPIKNIIFLMDDGRLLQYTDIQTGLGLIEIGKEEKGEIINIPEVKKSSSSINEPLFLPDEENLKRSIDIDDDDSDFKKSTSSSPDDTNTPDYTNTYEQLKNAVRDNIPLDQHPITEMLEIIFSILGFQMDNVSINHHSKILQNYMNDDYFKEIIFNISLYKVFAIAYVFIYINNLNIGYPLAIPGCKLTPNDDPRFILCVAIKSNFIKPKQNDFNINAQIAVLLSVMKTKLVPSNTSINIGNRFSLLKISQTSKQSIPIISKKINLMRFPLLDKSTNLQIQLKVKNFIIDKVNNRINKETNSDIKQILKTFTFNFDKYMSGILFRNLNQNYDLFENSIIIPYIKEYKQRIEFEKDKFYDNASKSTIINSIPKFTDLDKNLQEQIILQINSKIMNKLNSINDENEKSSLNYILNNYQNIIKLSSTDLKDLEISLISTIIPSEIMLIKAILEYHKIFSKLLKKFKLHYQETQEYKQRLQYKDNIEIQKLNKKVDKITLNKKRKI